MKCPHCREGFHETWQDLYVTAQGATNLSDADGAWHVKHTKCPDCKREVIALTVDNGELQLVRPRAANRPPPSPHVPPDYADDFREACLVIADSPKASAALSRRCLQNIIHNHFGIKKKNLSDEIDELQSSGDLPAYIGEAIDAIRNLGNFSAHPLKSTNTGEIMAVQPGEAEWCLDVVESLFDFCFIQPELLKQRRVALDAKLNEAGKPPMK